jgi:hypothetical protein
MVARAVRQDKEDIHFGKEEARPPLSSECHNPKEINKITITANECIQQSYKIHDQHSVINCLY